MFQSQIFQRCLVGHFNLNIAEQEDLIFNT